MKIVLTLKDIDNLSELKNVSSNFIVPTIFSNYTDYIFSEEDITNLLATEKELSFYLLINKLFFDEELALLRAFITKFAKRRVKFIFADLALYQILKELGIEHKGIYNPNTLVCNYMDFPFWKERNIFGLFPSLEIPLKDITIMGKNRSVKLFYQGFGYSPMFQTKRTILTNYKEYKGLDYDPKAINYHLVEETRNDKYFVLENEHQATIFQAGIHSSLEGLNSYANYIDYLVLDGRFIEDKKYLEACKLFVKTLEDPINIDIYDQQLKQVFDNITGDFLYNDSVFKKEDF